MKNELKIRYKLHGSQYQIFSDPSRFVVVTAGRRFGKTVLAVMKVIKTALEIEKANVWIVCPTYRQAEMIAWKMLFEMIPRELIKAKNEVKLQITLLNGSEIYLKGCDNEDSLRGTSCDLIVLDEFGDMKRHVWFEVLRPMLADRRGKAMFIGTPKGKNHFWELFIKGERKEDGYSSYRFKTEDNPYIQRSEILEAKSQLSERAFRQEFEASFEDYSGLVWPEFNHKNHVIDQIEIPKWWETLGAIDPAMAGTTASLFAAVDEDGCIYIFGEYYEQNRRVSEVSDSIRSKCQQWVIDPASQIRSVNRAGQLFSMFDEYADNGIYPRTAENDVDAGINRVAEYLKAGKIKIFKTCKHLLAEIERYHWTEEKETSGGMSKPKPYKAFDHAVDCLRYIVMARVESGKMAKVPLIKNSAIYLDRLEKQQHENDEVYE